MASSGSEITLLVLQRLHLRRTLHPVAFNARLRVLQADFALTDELRQFVLGPVVLDAGLFNWLRPQIREAIAAAEFK